MEQKNSKIDILNKKQRYYREVYYFLSSMQAGINIGLCRQKQEDSVLIMNHPLLDNIKLLAVADGMGGYENGAEASNIALLEIINWFDNCPLNIFRKEKKIFLELNQLVDYIDETIRKKCASGGTTLALSLVCNENTFFINIGDSRIYTYTKNNLVQISEDHSICWQKYSQGTIKEKDDIRFHKQNNLITSKLGGEKKNLSVNSLYLKNREYSDIYIFSDGITDVLSDEILKSLIQDNISIKPIFESVLETRSFNDYLDPNEYYREIPPGKDNCSAAALVKRKRLK